MISPIVRFIDCCSILVYWYLLWTT